MDGPCQEVQIIVIRYWDWVRSSFHNWIGNVLSKIARATIKFYLNVVMACSTALNLWLSGSYSCILNLGMWM